MPVKSVPTVGWTRKSVAVSVLLAMEEQRRRIGERVRRLREERNWSQEALAHASGLSVKTISRVENGRNDGRFDTFDRLAEAFGLASQDLFGPASPPLGLVADNQLDRVEAKLDAVLTALARAGLTEETDPRVELERELEERVQADRQARRLADADATSKPGQGRRRKAR